MWKHFLGPFHKCGTKVGEIKKQWCGGRFFSRTDNFIYFVMPKKCSFQLDWINRTVEPEWSTCLRQVENDLTKPIVKYAVRTSVKQHG